MEDSVREIGGRLIEYSREELTSARGLVSELFPYIAVAARRMSARSISRYLQERFGVKISAVTIAKALRQPEKYLEPVADRIEAAARRVASAQDVYMRVLLTKPDLFWHLREQRPQIGGITKDDQLRAFEHYEEALSILRDDWFGTDADVRDVIWDMLSLDDDKDSSDATVEAAEQPE